MDTHRLWGDDLVDIKIGDTGDFDDNLPEQGRIEHRYTVADGMDDVLVAILVDNRRLVNRFAQSFHITHSANWGKSGLLP